jgi:hypothetical protein
MARSAYVVTVPDSLVDTGLDEAVFPSKIQAQLAHNVVRSTRGMTCAEARQLTILKTTKRANTTFKAWNEAKHN